MAFESKPRLSQGPPEVPTQVRFTRRELEFIELRYGKELSRKEISKLMGITSYTVKFYSNCILLKLNIVARGGKSAAFIIKVTKFLLKNGYIKL